ncbi:MAG: cytochrome ubiquinol oxidase subunit I [Bacteroidales bacterium]|nr:cytochrome ubiquinol oxidase subunit I [Bacteroidales bacterium]MCD8387592.1 cytochrome ubiquinol oxidase subunit I [Bacteroidales bacterium]
MNELTSLVDWSRAQFALTAMYHWLFVPLTIGLSLIVAIMESIYVRTGQQKWKAITKFWMTLFGINFACGIATGLILEFEFGTNWSNYSWFVGDIFGAPLAIEGLLAFFMEATFVAVMFFGWNKVSRGFHLASTWLTAIGVSLSALWILIANAWMQYPVGMEFDPAQMRNVMDNFWDVALSTVAMHKFCHAVTSGWVLSAVFVVGVSSWLLYKKSNILMAKDSVRVASWVGLIGILLVMWTGDGSAVDVARVQPMKLAAMEGVYNGSRGQGLTGFGILNPDKKYDNDEETMLFAIEIPKGLSFLATHDFDAFVPGINDLINGISINEAGDTVYGITYADRMASGLLAQDALKLYGEAQAIGDQETMAQAAQVIKENYANFGYGYLQSPADAIPPVGMTFYAFHIMVIFGGYLLLLFVVLIFVCYRSDKTLENPWLCFFGLISIPIVYICSEAGWITAEVGRQPWTIQDVLPRNVAISDISAGSVEATFWVFAAIFTLLLFAEISIMVRFIINSEKKNIIPKQ